MADRCPNKSHRHWKNLVNHVGEFEAYRAFIAHGEEIHDDCRVIHDLKDLIKIL